MAKALWIGLLFLLWARILAVTVETGSLRAFLYGEEPGAAYDNWISHLAEGIADENYNIYAPYDLQTTGFGDFHVADSTETNAWCAMLDQFLAGNFANAQNILTESELPFQIVEFYNTDNGRTLYMIRELPDFKYIDDNGTEDSYDDETGAFTYGWGLYIYDPASTRPIIVTVPHPCDDFPSPALACEAFELWNAKFLLIAGAGREVKWTNIGNYDNNKSISDPSRAATHPFNYAYQRCANLIRTQFNTREWSAQLHSYDWNRHRGYANVQISAGNPKPCPNLPIRDLSNMKHDLINAGEHVMVPANTVGTHSEVLLNQFYAVRYSVHDFIFDDGVHSYAVNSSVDLPAYSSNRQMLYTLSGWNDYDSYDPFFHAEMDELPRCYGENSLSNYLWFYGWDEGTESWDFDNLFTHFLNYYSRWLEDMESVLDETFAMDDLVPPSAPLYLEITGMDEQSVTLAWDRSYSYDFESYEILCSLAPLGEGNYWICDRSAYPFLASQGCESITLNGLDTQSQYYFYIRALDKNNNRSALSNEATIYPEPPTIAVDPLAMDFGVVPVGDSQVQQFTVLNSGDDALTGQIAVPPGFSVSVNNPGKGSVRAVQGSGRWQRQIMEFSVEAESNKIFDLEFEPTQGIDYTSNLEISSNDAVSPTVYITLAGRGNNAPVITLPDSLSFAAGSVLQVDFSPYVFDPDGQSLSLQYGGNDGIEVSISGLTVTFGAGENWCGSEEITFTVSDGFSESSDTMVVCATAANLYARFKAFLQGPYVPGGLMEHGITNVLPLASPYDPAYAVISLPDVSPRYIVDWIYLELRLAANGATNQARSAFLLDDGSVADLEGHEYVGFDYAENRDYYVVLRHRNHLGIMSATAHTFSITPDSAPLIDLSVPGSVYGGNQAGVKLIETGVLALYSGDADANGAVLPSDLNLYWRIQTGLIGYREADFDLDGAVLPSDLNLHWRLNTGLQSQIPLNQSK